MWPKTDSTIRQKFALLISKGNFGDSKSARFQRLSLSVGQFSKFPRENGAAAFTEKRPSGSASRTPLHNSRFV